MPSLVKADAGMIIGYKVMAEEEIRIAVPETTTEVLDQQEPQADEQTQERIRFAYSKSNYYREILSDGAYGGLTPDLDLHVSFFNSHVHDPKEQVFYLTKQGRLGAEVKPETEGEHIQEINREVEVGVTMSLAAAINLARWLRGKIVEAQKIIGPELPEDVKEKISG